LPITKSEGKSKKKHFIKVDHLSCGGFSVGATISWLCSSEKKLYDGIIGFYGSRIRNYVDDGPICPSLLIYGSEEKSFNLKELTDVLGKKDMVEVKIFEGNQGFSDSYSKNYHEKSASQAFNKMVEFIFVCNKYKTTK
jgi:dienelactone hydrolase